MARILAVVRSSDTETFLRVLLREHELSLCRPGDHLTLLEPEGSDAVDLVLYELEDADVKGKAAIIALVGKLNDRIPVIALMRHADREQAAELAEGKVADCLCWPAAVDTWMEAIESALVSRTTKPAETIRFEGLVGSSPAMQKLFKSLLSIRAGQPVLFVGEPGTGRRVAARRLHAISSRKAGPFVVARCEGLSPDEQEIELFGCDPGAFSWQRKALLGNLDRAAGGTLLLCGVEDLASGAQMRLLGLLEEGHYRRHGGYETHRADVWLMAVATPALDMRLRERRFSQDLYWRLGTARIDVPALRERVSDLPELAQHFLSTATSKGPEILLSGETIEILKRYFFPGNLQELKNIVEAAAAACEQGVVRPLHLPAGVLRAAG